MKPLILIIALLWLSPISAALAQPIPEKPWMLGPFQKQNAVNPILTAQSGSTFYCPVRRERVRWEEKDVFNPATVVRNGRVYMLYRAEDVVGKFAGTSRLGLAVSTDGLHFQRRPEPVFYPANDALKPLEWEGGCEDPRIVESQNGVYVMTYTAYDGDKARLCVATSRNLTDWQKHGLAFGQAQGGRYGSGWSKSGAIVCRRVGHRFVAQKINGQYWMYWGDQPALYIAASPDLLHWTPLETDAAARPVADAVSDVAGKLRVVAAARPGRHDSRLLEPGPFALLTNAGIVLIYNGMNAEKTGDPALPEGAYTGGQLLFDAQNPARLLDRSETWFIRPDQPYETTGQVNQVVFLEGLVAFRGRWFLYYGTADSKIGVATAGQ
jgi:beta-1,2-mannosidase